MYVQDSIVYVEDSNIHVQAYILKSCNHYPHFLGKRPLGPHLQQLCIMQWVHWVHISDF
jgi:hypothetical protein